MVTGQREESLAVPGEDKAEASSWAVRGGSEVTRPSWPKGAARRGNRQAEARRGKVQGAHCLRVGERPEAVVVLLPGRVPQPQVHRLAVHHHVS